MAFIFADADRDELNRKRLQVGNVPHFVENYKTKTEKMPQFNFKNGQKIKLRGENYENQN